jgi:dTDP-4-dehydrorhamnose reductase
MNTIWVAGAKGQLGTEIELLHGQLHNAGFLFTDVDELDLRNEDAVDAFIRKHNPGFIVNCAAYTAVDKAETEIGKAFEINRGIPAILTKYADKAKAVLIHISTDFVFGGTSDRPYTEEDIPDPLSVYAKSKRAGEEEVLKVRRNIIIRTSWLYSAHGTNFVKTMIRLGSEKNEINVVDDQKGSPTWAKDLAAAVLHIITKISAGPDISGGIYHYSNEGSCSWYGFATEIMKLAGLKCRVNPITTGQYPLPAKRPAFSIMDKSKIKHVFGMEIPEWKESLGKFLAGGMPPST